MGVPKKGFLEQLRVRLSLKGLYLFNGGLLSTYCGPDFALGTRIWQGTKQTKSSSPRLEVLVGKTEEVKEVKQISSKLGKKKKKKKTKEKI